MSDETCTCWNWEHECGLPADHLGNHKCGGCHDAWNRGEWDDDPDEWDRPETRCSNDLAERQAEVDAEILKRIRLI